MKAFVADRYGNDDAVRATEMPVPAVADDDVLVRIDAAGMNPVDIKTRDGNEKDRIGAFAEYAAIHEDAVAHKPKTLTMEQAASIPLVGLTSWQAHRRKSAAQTLQLQRVGRSELDVDPTVGGFLSGDRHELIGHHWFRPNGSALKLVAMLKQAAAIPGFLAPLTGP